MSEVLLLHYNAKSHTSVCTTETVTEFGWTLLLYHLYSCDLAQSHFH